MLRINVLGGLYINGDGRPAGGAAAQPRRLALMALLAVAGDRAVTRDSLLAYLWPDVDEERGRRALTQALYALRRDLGAEEVFLGTKDLRLNPDLVTTDFGEFHQALASDELERAARVYRGPFLEGFHLPGAESFGRWREEQRGTLAHEFEGLLGNLAKRSQERGDAREAIGWLRRLAALDPLNAQVAAGLMRAQAEAGDIAGALQHARIYEALVRQQLDLPPDRQVVDMAERLRRGQEQAVGETQVGQGEIPAAGEPAGIVAHSAPARLGVPMSLPSGHQAEEPTQDLGYTSGWAIQSPPVGVSLRPRAPPPLSSRWLHLVAIPLVAVLGLVTVLVWPRTARQATDRPRVVAVGGIAYYGNEGAATPGQPLADMLATNLARVGELRVISHARMVEVMRQLGYGSDSSAASAAVARRAGATELVDGSLYDVAPGVLRLDLRRIDLASGSVLEAYTVQGPDLFALADSGTSRLAADLGGTRPAESLAEVSTRSAVAYQLYEEGLRTFYGGDRPEAERLFERALGMDSTFAMAAFYYAQGLTGTRAEFLRRLRRALTLADGASDRERLLIRGAWAFLNSSPALRAIADTLTVRYPAELEGYLMEGQAAILGGEYDQAHAPLRQVIAGDSLGLSSRAARCLACEAFSALVTSYVEEDSLPAALGVAAEWTRLEPTAGLPWRHLAAILGQRGRVDQGFAALRVADSLSPGDPAAWRSVAGLDLMGGRFTEATELARVQMKAGLPSERSEARRLLTIVYRHQGRLREALEVARSYRDSNVEPTSLGAAPPTALLEAQVLMEQGHFGEAAVLFDSIGRNSVAPEDSSAAARTRVWTWALMATALAAARDTIRFAGLVDSARQRGQLSAYAWDRRMHYYIRGLLERARGHHEEAVTAFRAAIVSPTMGFTRINYALAGEYLTLNRPAEAVATLQSAQRGSFDGSNSYLTHTDLMERLAQAFESAGERDSAAVYYARIAEAWQNSDPVFTPRHYEARNKAMRMLEKH